MSHRETTKKLVQAARQNWQGCDWPTEFGPRRLKLFGIRARQAYLAAKATRGDEAATWDEAARWLSTVERDAARAAEFASKGVKAAERRDWSTANSYFERAAEIEAVYAKTSYYQEVLDSLTRWCQSESKRTLRH